MYIIKPCFLYFLPNHLLLTSRSCVRALERSLIPTYSSHTPMLQLVATTETDRKLSFQAFFVHIKTESGRQKPGMVHCSFSSFSAFSCSPGLGVRTRFPAGNHFTEASLHSTRRYWVTINSTKSLGSKPWSTDVNGRAPMNFSWGRISPLFLVLQNQNPHD